jgi:hypothetical protein
MLLAVLYVVSSLPLHELEEENSRLMQEMGKGQ